MGGAGSKRALGNRNVPHKLTYFFIAGPCFATRVCLRKAGVPFTDERLIMDVQWPTYPRDRLPLGQLPVLQVGDVTYSQGLSISRYAAQLAV